jgi:hypothetical protein
MSTEESNKGIYDIRDDYNNNEYENKFPYPSNVTIKVDHIFDENQTVKWNREKVLIENKKIIDQKLEYAKESTRLSSKLDDDMVKAIVQEYGFTENEARIIYSHAYSEKHSCMSDVFLYTSTLSDLFNRLLKS